MIRLSLCLHERRYEACDGDWRPEWPPQPYRLLAALVAAAHTAPDISEASFDALERLGREGKVTALWADPRFSFSLVQTQKPTSYYSPTWEKDKKKSSPFSIALVIPGSSERPAGNVWANPAAHVGVPQVHVDVAGVDDLDVAALDALAQHVSWVGRDTALVTMTVHRVPAARPADPGDGTAPHYGTVRTWDSESIRLMREYHQEVFGESPRVSGDKPAGVMQSLERPDTRHKGAVVPFTRRLLPKVVPARFTRLHTELLQAIPNAQLGLLPLAVVGGEGSTGNVAAAFIVAENAEVAAKAEQFLRDLPDMGRCAPWKGHPSADPADPGRWVTPSRRWTSSTPMLVPSRQDHAQQLVAQSFAKATGVGVLAVRVHYSPFQQGQIEWPAPNGGFPDRLVQGWVELLTDSPATGPVRIGSGRPAGFGVLRPDRQTKNVVVCLSQASWVSSTPMLVFRHQDRAERAVARWFTNTAGARVKSVTVHYNPFHPGQTRWKEPAGGFPGGFVQGWVELDTDTPVEGPIQIGPETSAGFGTLLHNPHAQKADK